MRTLLLLPELSRCPVGVDKHRPLSMTSASSRDDVSRCNSPPAETVSFASARAQPQPSPKRDTHTRSSQQRPRAHAFGNGAVRNNEITISQNPNNNERPPKVPRFPERLTLARTIGSRAAGRRKLNLGPFWPANVTSAICFFPRNSRRPPRRSFPGFGFLCRDAPRFGGDGM